jgi:hypothetical protein
LIVFEGKELHFLALRNDPKMFSDDIHKLDCRPQRRLLRIDHYR